MTNTMLLLLCLYVAFLFQANHSYQFAKFFFPKTLSRVQNDCHSSPLTRQNTQTNRQTPFRYSLTPLQSTPDNSQSPADTKSTLKDDFDIEDLMNFDFSSGAEDVSTEPIKPVSKPPSRPVYSNPPPQINTERNKPIPTTKPIPVHNKPDRVALPTVPITTPITTNTTTNTISSANTTNSLQSAQKLGCSCSHCNAFYLVPSDTFRRPGQRGHEVTCSQCNTTWLQLYDRLVYLTDKDELIPYHTTIHTSNTTTNTPSNTTASRVLLPRQLFIGQLPEDMTPDLLGALFAEYGVLSSVIARYNDGLPRGFGFVEFGTEEGALQALEEMNGLVLQQHIGTGRSLTVERSSVKPYAPRSPPTPASSR